MEPVEENPNVDCPHCGSRRDVHPVTVLEPNSPELEALFDGTLNQETCDACGVSFVLQVPIVYRDDEAHVLIYYLPLEDREQEAEAEEKMEGVTEQIFGREDTPEPPDCRLVLNRRRFVEKIALHEDGLDDRLVEYIKYQLHNRPDNKIDPVRSELFYDFTNADEQTLPFILFDRETGEPRAGTHVPMDLYHELKRTFLTDDDMARELEQLFPGYRVTVEKILG